MAERGKDRKLATPPISEGGHSAIPEDPPVGLGMLLLEADVVGVALLVEVETDFGWRTRRRGRL